MVTFVRCVVRLCIVEYVIKGNIEVFSVIPFINHLHESNWSVCHHLIIDSATGVGDGKNLPIAFPDQNVCQYLNCLCISSCFIHTMILLFNHGDYFIIFIENIVARKFLSNVHRDKGVWIKKCFQSLHEVLCISCDKCISQILLMYCCFDILNHFIDRK